MNGPNGNSCLIIELPDVRRSGRTTLALAMVRGMAAAGKSAYYVVASPDQTREVLRDRLLPPENIESALRIVEGRARPASLVVLDNWGLMINRHEVLAAAIALVQLREIHGQVVVIP